MLYYLTVMKFTKEKREGEENRKFRRGGLRGLGRFGEGKEMKN
jgi:hypothetical protein